MVRHRVATRYCGGFQNTCTTRFIALSLHDALPISARRALAEVDLEEAARVPVGRYSHGMQKRLSVARALLTAPDVDRKSTRLNSSHLVISYAVFCLKKKKP